MTNHFNQNPAQNVDQSPRSSRLSGFLNNIVRVMGSPEAAWGKELSSGRPGIAWYRDDELAQGAFKPMANTDNMVPRHIEPPQGTDGAGPQAA